MLGPPPPYVFSEMDVPPSDIHAPRVDETLRILILPSPTSSPLFSKNAAPVGKPLREDRAIERARSGLYHFATILLSSGPGDGPQSIFSDSFVGGAFPRLAGIKRATSLYRHVPFRPGPFLPKIRLFFFPCTFFPPSAPDSVSPPPGLGPRPWPPSQGSIVVTS